MESSASSNTADVLFIAKLNDELEHVRNSAHPGYAVVKDNIDLRTHARCTTHSYKDRHEHMFQLNIVENKTLKFFNYIFIMKTITLHVVHRRVA